MWAKLIPLWPQSAWLSAKRWQARAWCSTSPWTFAHSPSLWTPRARRPCPARSRRRPAHQPWGETWGAERSSSTKRSLNHLKPRTVILTRKPVRAPLSLVTNVRMSPKTRKVWKFTKAKHTRLLRRCEGHQLTLLLWCLPSGKVVGSYLATTVVKTCLLLIFAKKSPVKYSNVTRVRKYSTLKLSLRTTNKP